jgi:hypothetical protein
MVLLMPIVPEVLNSVWVGLAFRMLRSVQSENYFLQSRQVAQQSITFVFLTLSGIIAFFFMNHSESADWYFTVVLVCVLIEWAG